MEVTPETIAAYQPKINEDPDTLRSIYHLAISGAGISYGDVSGRALAADAARDLHCLGYEEGRGWLIDINRHRLEQLDASWAEDSAYMGMSRYFAAKSLQELEAISMEEFEGIVSYAVDNGVFETNFSEDGDFGSENEVVVKRSLLMSVLELKKAGFEDLDGDISRGYQGLMDATLRYVDESNDLGTGYDYAKSLRETARIHLTSSAMDIFRVQVVEMFDLVASRYRAAATSPDRSAAVNAAIDLRDFFPRDKFYRRQFKAIRREIGSKIFMGADDYRGGLDDETYLRLVQASHYDVEHVINTIIAYSQLQE